MSGPAPPRAQGASSPPRAQGAFSPWAAFWMIAVGVFAFSAFVTLYTFAPDFSRGDDGGGHALSRSAVGFAGAVKLEQMRGRAVLVSRGARLGRDAFLIATPQQGVKKAELTALGPRTRLIILPKWITAPDPAHPGWVLGYGALPPEAVAAILADVAPKAQIDQAKGSAPASLARVDIPGRLPAPLVSGPIAHLQTISGPGLHPVFADARGRMVLAALDDNATYILADPDFLNTQGLASIATARAGVAMLDELSPPSRPLAFDVTLNGFSRSRSLLKMALEPPFLAATLAGLAAALLIGWRAAIRFGAPARAARAIALGKRALADNSAGLVRLAGRERAMIWPYALVTRALVARAIAARTDQTQEDLSALLDRIGDAQNVAAHYSDLAAEAASVASDGSMITTPRPALATARKLYQWRTEMTRAAY
jgi:hypothetical protein